MTVKTFTREQFESALTDILSSKGQETAWKYQGLILGEHCYIIPVKDTNKRLLIRSSIKKSGRSASTGKDSIRLYVQYFYQARWFVLGKQTYTQRTPGWQTRMGDKLRKLYKMALEDSKQAPGETLSGKLEKQENSKPKNKVSSGVDLSASRVDVVISSPPQGASTFSVGETLAAMAEDDLEQEEIAPREKVSFSLNIHQQAIVDNQGKGPHVVEACPGSGKTRTIESLVASLIENGANPLRIGAFTFNKKAAAEMRRRIALTLWPDATQQMLDFFEDPHGDHGFSQAWVKADPAREMLTRWTCTIHALSYRLLKAYCDSTGASKPKVLSGKLKFEADNMIKDSLDELNWSEGPKAIKAWISHFIINLVQPHDAEQWAADRLPGDCIHYAGKLAEIYRRYYDLLKLKNMVDFDMMQSRIIVLLKSNEKFRAWAASQFDYILVDEAQDTSPQQSEILFALAQGSGNVAFVGDVDQSMYKFRGAQPSILRDDFMAVWGENTKRFNLPVNYRSTKAIVSASARLIENNYNDETTQYLKPFEPGPDASDGQGVKYIETENFAALAQEVVNLVIDSETPGDWFVLSRTRAECAAIHTALVANKLPAINKSGGLLFGIAPIRKAIAYLQLACNYNDARDNLEILEEIANVATVDFRAPWTRRRHVQGCRNTKSWVACGCPVIAEDGVDYSHSRFYGKKAIREARNWEGVKRQQYDKNRGGFSTAKAKGAKDLVSFVSRLEKYQTSASDCLAMILEQCLVPWLAAKSGLTDDDLAENGDIELFDVLTSMIEPGQSVEQFLGYIDGVSRVNTGKESESVLVGTIHWSKGAERPCVIVNTTRMPIVPPQRKPGQLPVGGGVDLHEERRLLYVGMTRAENEVYLLGSKKWAGMPTNPDTLVREVL